MAGLKDLNVDLLYVIFSHLQSDKRQLHDIALSCRLFRDIAQRFIVRDVTLSHSPMHSRTKLFLRTLEERPDLTVQVHCLRFDLLREDIHWPEEQHVISRITRLLTNLREFCYLSRDYKPWHYGVSLPLKWWRDGVHDQVRRVEWHHNMQPKALVKCMQLPRIESIYCRELQDISTKSSSISIVSPDLYGSSSVRELHIGSHLGLPFDALRLMLQVPRCLRKLVLSYHDEFQSGAQVDRIPWLLEPVQESLEELSIEKHRGMLPPPGEVVDLSALCCLRKLSIPFRYVFGKRPGKSFKADTLLPPQLSELRVKSSILYLEETLISII